MLRTCIGADGTAAKDFPNYAENKIRFENGNGDILSGRGERHRGHGAGGGDSNHWREGGGVMRGHNGHSAHAHNGHTELKEALAELLPEEIPGLPRHRPGEFSPRWVHWRTRHCICEHIVSLRPMLQLERNYKQIWSWYDEGFYKSRDLDCRVQTEQDMSVPMS